MVYIYLEEVVLILVMWVIEYVGMEGVVYWGSMEVFFVECLRYFFYLCVVDKYLK